MMEEKAAINVKVNAEVKTEAQVRGLREGLTLTDVIERFLAAWVMDEVDLPEPIEGKSVLANQAMTDAVLVGA